jgi:hypothetical protein
MRKYISAVVSIFIILSISHTCINSASAENVEPNPIIRANDSDGPFSMNSTDNLTITIELSPGGFAGDNADWWLIAATPFGLFHYQPVDSLWVPDLICSHQGPLFNLGEFEVLNISGLPAGSYTLYFGVDMDMNGTLDIDQVYYDSVTINMSDGGGNPEDIDDDGDGYTENQGDCDDSDATVNPGTSEICGDRIDNNCNDQIDEECPRFTDMGDGTVRDSDTGLFWLKNANSFEGMDWAEAKAAAANLNSGERGLSDGSSSGEWRLPAKIELQGIGTAPQTTWYSKYPSADWTKPGKPFTSVQTLVLYWSSTGNGTGEVWCVDMYDGYTYSHDKDYEAYTWLVRSEKD